MGENPENIVSRGQKKRISRTDKMITEVIKRSKSEEKNNIYQGSVHWWEIFERKILVKAIMKMYVFNICFSYVRG